MLTSSTAAGAENRNPGIVPPWLNRPARNPGIVPPHLQQPVRILPIDAPITILPVDLPVGETQFVRQSISTSPTSLIDALRAR